MKAALIRLPVVVFPGSPLSLRVRSCKEVKRVASRAWEPKRETSHLPFELMRKCEADGGRLLATVPFGCPGLAIHLQLTQRAGDLAHFVVVDRVRLLPESPEPDRLLDVEHHVLADRAELESSPELVERAAEESVIARELVRAGERSGTLRLDPGLSALGITHAEMCKHPFWAASKVLPDDPLALSFWLPTMLPLAPELKARVLSAFCSLWRLQTSIDAMRFLGADSPDDARYTHRFTRMYSTDSPVLDVSQSFGFLARPRVTVGVARPLASPAALAYPTAGPEAGHARRQD